MKLQLFAKAKIAGVDDDTLSKIQQQYQQSQAVTDANAKTQSALQKVGELSNKYASGNIVSKDRWNTINSGYQMSSYVKDAMSYTDGLLEQLSTGKTSYSDKVADMVDQIMNKDKFSYDVDKDVLFQNALASSMRTGQGAMQDTIGQASALTGGYGSSYATSAGNQAYNAYIQQAYDNLPEYYNMALQTYQQDLANDYNKLGMLNTQDDKEYSRLDNAYVRNFQDWTQKYDMEYNQWRDSVNIALQAAGLEINEAGTVSNMLTNTYNARSDYENNLYNREYGQYRDQKADAYNYAELTSNDYWKKYSASKSGSGSYSKGIDEALIKKAAELFDAGVIDGTADYFKSLGMSEEDVERYRKYTDSYVNNVAAAERDEEAKKLQEENLKRTQEAKAANAEEAKKQAEIREKNFQDAVNLVDSLIYDKDGNKTDDAKTIAIAIDRAKNKHDLTDEQVDKLVQKFA